MTIDDVMYKIEDWYRDESSWLIDDVRAAILALLDEEAEACAELSDAEDSAIKASLAIRARIAARKGGAKP